MNSVHWVCLLAGDLLLQMLWFYCAADAVDSLLQMMLIY